jgi:hypothetical protein
MESEVGEVQENNNPKSSETARVVQGKTWSQKDVDSK